MMLRRTLSAAKRLLQLSYQLDFQLQRVQEALGRIEYRQIEGPRERDLEEAEFRVWSQWGEDGIVQWLTKRIRIENKVFVEFGVENYREANTRFLLENDSWSGLVLDSSEKNIETIRSEPAYWRHNLKARAAFITRENINDLILSEGLSGEIGLLSIDIDGNDYWIWQAIEAIRPALIVCEYNSLFGRNSKVSIPYRHGFSRAAAHFSHLYFGASLGALDYLGHNKGYSLVHVGRAGVNAFFVRDDLLNRIPRRSASEIFVLAQHRESRDPAGRLSYLSTRDASSAIALLEVVDVETGQLMTVQDAVRL
jgi:hypothetical protein